MPQARHYFATPNDLVPGVQALERRTRLKYVLSRYYMEPTVECFDTVTAIPEFGSETVGDVLSTRCFLVLSAEDEVKLRVRTVPEGVTVFGTDVLENPRALRWHPGGFFGQEALLAGLVDYAYADPAAVSLYRRFTRTVMKAFTRVEYFWVGPEAMRLARRGLRLVPNDARKVGGDLRLPPCS